MPSVLLRIKWDGVTEFISIDPNDSSISRSIINTKEYWHEENETVTYNVFCSKFAKTDSKLHICLEYNESKNLKLKGRNECWGKSEIVINLASKKANATWSDIRNGNGYSGTAKSCVVLEDSLLDEMTYEEISRIKRPKQSVVRQTLLQIYGKCALSGETTNTVLDVAHIIEAGKKGAYTLKNCLLLRADLHRLFDRGQLKFSMNGTVVLSPDVKGNYYNEISRKRLPPEVMDHVREALRVRYKRKPGD
jgi:hypothetical protein